MTVPLHKVICPLAFLLSACPTVEQCLGSLDLRTVPSQATHLAWAGAGATSSLTARFSANHLLLTAVLGYDLSVFHALGTFCKHVLIWWITRKSCVFPACREAVKAVASASGQQRWWCCGLKRVTPPHRVLIDWALAQWALLAQLLLQRRQNTALWDRLFSLRSPGHLSQPSPVSATRLLL